MSVLDDIETTAGKFEDAYADKIAEKVMEMIQPFIWEKVSLNTFNERIDELVNTMCRLESDINFLKSLVTDSKNPAGFSTHDQIYLG